MPAGKADLEKYNTSYPQPNLSSILQGMATNAIANQKLTNIPGRLKSKQTQVLGKSVNAPVLLKYERQEFTNPVSQTTQAKTNFPDSRRGYSQVAASKQANTSLAQYQMPFSQPPRKQATAPYSGGRGLSARPSPPGTPSPL